MVLSGMVVFTFVAPLAGYLSDKGHRRINATIVVCIVAAGTSIPMFMAFRTKNLVACWVLQVFSLCMTAYTMGVLPAICSSIYPAGVRISGFNLGKLCLQLSLTCIHRVCVVHTHTHCCAHRHTPRRNPVFAQQRMTGDDAIPIAG